MQSKEQFCNLISRSILRVAMAALAMAIVFALMVVLTQSAQAQTFKVIYNFTAGGDGGYPFAGLTLDRAGNLYGTAALGGSGGGGTVFKLSRRGSGWTLTLFTALLVAATGLTPTPGWSSGRTAVSTAQLIQEEAAMAARFST